MTSAPPGTRAGPGIPAPEAGVPEALIREARRRQRRRWLAIGVAVAAALAGAGGVAGVMGGHPAGPQRHPAAKAAPQAPAPGPIPHSIGTSLLMWPASYPSFGPGGGPPAYVDDLSTGRVTQSKRAAVGAGDYQPLLVHVGHWFVYAGNGTTAIRDDLTGPRRVLGPTPFFAPATAPGRVWLFRAREGAQGPIRAWTVPLAAGRPSQPVTLPAGAYLPAVRGTEAGLLLQLPSGLALWNPGHAPRTLPYRPGLADGFDATARLVAYGTGCTSQSTRADAPQEPSAAYETCQYLRILNADTGKLTSFPAPQGTAGWVPSGFSLVSAISPGNQRIAAYAATTPQGDGQVRLYTLRAAAPSQQPTRVPSSAAYLPARTAWSAEGTWLLYQGPENRLWAYEVKSGRTGASNTPCCHYTVLAATPSSRNHR